MATGFLGIYLLLISSWREYMSTKPAQVSSKNIGMGEKIQVSVLEAYRANSSEICYQTSQMLTMPTDGNYKQYVVLCHQ
jgi:hypothetical protein